MFNLLPEEQKKNIYKNYRLRLATLILFFLGFGGVITFIVLLPSFFVVNLKYDSLVKQQTKLEEENPDLLNIKELESEIVLQKNKLKIIGTSEEVLPSKTIEKILSSMVSGITINSISLEKSEGFVEVFLEGYALKRDSLLIFSKNIGEEAVFSEVDLPVSDLAKERDIVFSLTFVTNLNYGE